MRLLLSFTLVAMLCALAIAAPIRAQRAPDALLQRPDLQQLVELQTARDAAGLIARLQDEDPAVRARAAFALASVQDSAATPALLRRLNDATPAVRADAAFALGQQPGDVPSDVLLAALAGEPDRTTSRQLMEALGKTGDRYSLVALAEQDVPAADEAARALAVARYALRDLHEPVATEHLVRLLRSDDARTRLAAGYYFGRSRQSDPWQPYLDDVRAALDALERDDPAAMHLVTALGRNASDEDAARLVDWLRAGADWRTRTNAARALSAYADSEHVQQALVEALDDPSHHVAVSAATALADAQWHVATVQAATSYVDAHRRDTTTRAARVASHLLEGLARAGRTQFVRNAVTDAREHSAVAYRHGLRALVPVPHDVAFPLLEAAAEVEDPRVAYAALAALSSRWRSAEDAGHARAYFTIFADAVRRADVATVYAAAPLLADSVFVQYGGVDVLMDTYRTLEPPADLEAMTSILRALGTAGAPEALPLLKDAFLHPNPTIAATAADAYEAISDAPPTHAPTEEQKMSSDRETTVPPLDWAHLQQLGPRPRLVLETRCGSVTLQLDAEQAPQTAQTLARLTERGAYDGVPFHRVVPNFVVQGGDFARGDGFGGPGFVIRSEFTRIPYRRGTAGMASAGKDTEGSQFFVAHSMQPHLDGRYTAFGTVTEGLGAVDCIQQDDVVTEARILPDER